MSVDLSLQTFAPGTCILVTDIMTSIQKLCEVTESGQAYIDLSDDPCPFPIYTVMQPVDVGNPGAWAEEARQRGAGSDFLIVTRRLVSEGVDRLTCLRALYWCSRSAHYDYEPAIEAARLATAEVMNARKYMDEIIFRTAAGTEGSLESSFLH